MVTVPKAFHGGASFEAIGVDLRDLSGRSEIVDADVLDAWYPPAPGVLAAISKHLPWLIKTSPPTHGDGLRRAIAQSRAVDPDRILIGSGTSSLMFLALPRLIKPGDTVTILDPMYGEYAHLAEHVIGANLRRAELRFESDFLPDLADLARAAQGSQLVILVNPNSPTGRVVAPEFIRDLLAQLDSNTKLWVDETYIDFAGSGMSAECIEDPRLIISKSMSKYYALSGLRVGYLVGDPGSIRSMELFSPPWSVGLIGQLAGIEALSDPEYYTAMAQETHRLREDFRRAVSAVPGFRALPAEANYFMIELANSDAQAQVERLRAHGVYLRNCDSLSPRFNGRYLRTAVKSPAENDRIVAAIQQAP